MCRINNRMLMKLGPMCFYGIKTLPNNFEQHSNDITTPCLCNFHKASVLIILKKYIGKGSNINRMLLKVVG